MQWVEKGEAPSDWHHDLHAGQGGLNRCATHAHRMVDRVSELSQPGAQHLVTASGEGRVDPVAEALAPEVPWDREHAPDVGVHDGQIVGLSLPTVAVHDAYSGGHGR